MPQASLLPSLAGLEHGRTIPLADIRRIEILQCSGLLRLELIFEPRGSRNILTLIGDHKFAAVCTYVRYSLAIWEDTMMENASLVGSGDFAAMHESGDGPTRTYGHVRFCPAIEG